MADDASPIDKALADDDFAQAEEVGAETVEFIPDSGEAGADASLSGADSGPTIEEQLKSAEDRALRLQAELQNVLNRSRREVEEVRKYGALGVARDLLPAIDNIDRALEVAKQQEAGGESDLADGFRMVRDQLVGVLAQHGCQPIDAAPGVEFDPTLHEAILQQPSDDAPAGAVLQATQTGYKLHDRVVRAAQVIVSAGPAGA